MSFRDIAGKVGKTLVRGASSYFENQSRSSAKRSDFYTEE